MYIMDTQTSDSMLFPFQDTRNAKNYSEQFGTQIEKRFWQ